MDLMYIHILQCFRTCGAESATAFCYEEQKGDVIAVFAIASFLAGTRNLVLDLRCALADIVPSLRLDP